MFEDMPRPGFELTVLPSRVKVVVVCLFVAAVLVGMTITLFAPQRMGWSLRLALAGILAASLPAVRRYAIKIDRAQLYLAAAPTDRPFVSRFPETEFLALCVVILDAALLIALPNLPQPYFAVVGVISVAALCWFVPASIRFQRIVRRAFPSLDGI